MFTPAVSGMPGAGNSRLAPAYSSLPFLIRTRPLGGDMSRHASSITHALAVPVHSSRAASYLTRSFSTFIAPTSTLIGPIAAFSTIMRSGVANS